MFNRIFKDKVFLTNLGMLAIPIVINELINSLVNLMDTFMTGKLGAQSVAAVGLGNQVFFLFTLITFGINSGASVFMGQYYGKGELDNLHRVMGIAFILSMIDAAAFCFGAVFLPRQIMSIYSKDEAVIELGIGYLRTIGISYFFTALTVTVNTALKATGKAIQPMATTFVSLICNIIFNSIFIFMLKMGVRGAALGTVCARIIELGTIIVLITAKKSAILTGFKNYFDLSAGFIKNYFKTATPVLLNEFAWALGTSVYNIAYKYSGTVAQASVQVAGVVQNLFAVVGMGVGASCGILLANALGAGDVKKAKDYSQRCTVITIIITIITGIILALLNSFIVSLFDIDDIGREYAHTMLIIVAVGMLFKNINYINVVGILRSGGDTLACFLIDTGSVWLVGVPMAFLGSAILHLPIYITFAMVYMEEVFKIFITTHRVVKGKWIKQLI